MCSAVMMSLLCALSAEHGDRHGGADGGTDRPGGQRGPEPRLPEGSEAQTLRQVEEVKRKEGLKTC